MSRGFFLFLLFDNQNTSPTIAAITTTAIPTLMPTIAPVLRPESELCALAESATDACVPEDVALDVEDALPLAGAVEDAVEAAPDEVGMKSTIVIDDCRRASGADSSTIAFVEVEQLASSASQHAQRESVALYVKPVLNRPSVKPLAHQPISSHHIHSSCVMGSRLTTSLLTTFILQCLIRT